MSRKRVKSFGLGKITIEIDFDELPEDIQQGLIDIFSEVKGSKITKDTKKVAMLCDAIISRDKNN